MFNSKSPRNTLYSATEWLRKKIHAFPRMHRFLVNLAMCYYRKREDINRLLNVKAITLITEFPLFAPSSPGPYKKLAALTKKSINQTLPSIVRFIESISGQSVQGPIPIENFAVADPEELSIPQLKHLFDKHRSDKSTAHDYHLLYARILRNRVVNVKLLEIGLGTNNTSIVSNMGARGAPGASLRAFAEFLPNALIYGADVDRKILFETDRIKTYFVDQTEFNSIERLFEQLPNDFDLIIDDGLHSPNANIACLAFAATNLKEGGWYVVEDIAEAALPVWQIISELMPIPYQSWILRAKNGFLFVVRRGARAGEVEWGQRRDIRRIAH